MEPMHGMYGTSDAVLEVQHTVQSGELTSFLCLTRVIIGPTTTHVDNKRIIDGLWRGAMKCTELIKKEHLLLEVEHDVRAHETQMEKQEMTVLEKIVTERNERADELAKNEAMLDEGEMA